MEKKTAIIGVHNVRVTVIGGANVKYTASGHAQIYTPDALCLSHLMVDCYIYCQGDFCYCLTMSSSLYQ